MAIVTKLYTFSSGAVIVAAEHNSNFDTLYNLVNGSIDDANISASANIASSKLASITTAGKVSGAALTSLSSTPSGAGLLPVANLGAIGTTTPAAGAFTTLKVGTTNQGDILYDNGTSLVRLTPGTSGQVLKTQGSAANPIWGAGSIDVQSFTSSGTWTKPASGTWALIRGGGGGGSGGSATEGNDASGGGGGATSEYWVILSSLGATEAVTIPAIAAAVTNADGNAGGDVTFGTHFTFYGGGAGQENGGGAGGGGIHSAGSAGTGGGGGAGGGLIGGAASTGSTVAGASSIYGGGGGGGVSYAAGDAGLVGGDSIWGGGGGAGGVFSGSGAGALGGKSIYGGGGGGGSGGSTTGGAGGTSKKGGAGGAGATTSGAATAGTDGAGGYAGGGGGGSEAGLSGAGGKGSLIVYVF